MLTGSIFLPTLESAKFVRSIGKFGVVLHAIKVFQAFSSFWKAQLPAPPPLGPNAFVVFIAVRVPVPVDPAAARFAALVLEAHLVVIVLGTAHPDNGVF